MSDRILKRTGSANLARKLPIVGGMLLASTIVIANFVPAGSDALVIAIMSLAFFGQGMTNLGWTVISDVAPKELIGLTAGIFNFSANLAGIVTPLVIGYAYQSTGSFVGPLVYIGVVALIGAFSYSVILGDIHRLTVEHRLMDADQTCSRESTTTSKRSSCGDDPALAQNLADADAAGLPADPGVGEPGAAALLCWPRSRGASGILEIGTLGGYSTTWLARALPPGGIVVSLELDASHAEVADAERRARRHRRRA